MVEFWVQGLLCNLSYFFMGVMKMDDIDPFGYHDKMDVQPDETGETIIFT